MSIVSAAGQLISLSFLILKDWTAIKRDIVV
jgi:hypothetical protein